MSRILRRPMFRGGRVSSYGTGIAAPLVPGYAGGGQIGGGIIYGKPMADGRYGFKEPEITVGAELLEKNNPNFSGSLSDVKKDFLKMKQGHEWAQQDTQLTDEYIREKFEDAVLKNKRNVETGGISETDLAYGMQIAQPIEDEDILFHKAIGKYGKDHVYDLWREGQSGIDDTNWNKKQAEQEKKYGVNLSDRPDKETTVDPEMQKLLDRIAFLEGQQSTVEPEVDAKTAVAENKELFRDLLGYDKAKGQDISDMLLGFAGAEGDDTWSKTKSFFKDEAKRPGRAQKISDAAGTLAIQDYISGKRSKEKMMSDKSKIDYAQDVKIKALIPSLDDDLSTALTKFANAYDAKPNSDVTLRELIKFKTKEPVFRVEMKIEDLEKKKKKLKVGYNIIQDENQKIFVKFDGTTADIQTLDEIWSS